jgi:ferredoxin-thioredoxin reductase catalytic chain
MNAQELRAVYERFTEGNDFRLNPDEAHVEAIVGGVLENERDCGLKLCPCRIRDGTREQDLKLLCPCNFKAQQKWREKGECWCGLFVKR